VTVTVMVTFNFTFTFSFTFTVQTYSPWGICDESTVGYYFIILQILLILFTIYTLFGPRLGCAREYGSVMVDQKIVSDHDKYAIFVIATFTVQTYSP
jgi:hypothetical protein